MKSPLQVLSTILLCLSPLALSSNAAELTVPAHSPSRQPAQKLIPLADIALAPSRSTNSPPQPIILMNEFQALHAVPEGTWEYTETTRSVLSRGKTEPWRSYKIITTIRQVDKAKAFDLLRVPVDAVWTVKKLSSGGGNWVEAKGESEGMFNCETGELVLLPKKMATDQRLASGYWLREVGKHWVHTNDTLFYLGPITEVKVANGDEPASATLETQPNVIARRIYQP